MLCLLCLNWLDSHISAFFFKKNNWRNRIKLICWLVDEFIWRFFCFLQTKIHWDKNKILLLKSAFILFSVCPWARRTQVKNAHKNCIKIASSQILPRKTNKEVHLWRSHGLNCPFLSISTFFPFCFQFHSVIIFLIKYISVWSTHNGACFLLELWC